MDGSATETAASEPATRVRARSGRRTLCGDRIDRDVSMNHLGEWGNGAQPTVGTTPITLNRRIDRNRPRRLHVRPANVQGPQVAPRNGGMLHRPFSTNDPLITVKRGATVGDTDVTDTDVKRALPG
jgi:hypothetical protein